MIENESLVEDRRRRTLPTEVCRGSLMAMLFDGRAPSENWIELLTDRMQAREVAR